MKSQPHNKKDSVRINVRLVELGVASRKEADAFIEQGLVRVNGVSATLGMQVFPLDKIVIDKKAADKKYAYFAYHKAPGIVTTNAQKREVDIIHETRFPEKVYPVGRLDKDSRGLIIMTSDGRITKQLLDSEHKHEKEYIVTTEKNINDNFIKKISQGVDLSDFTTLPAKAKQLDDRVFSIILIEGKNRQIRRMVARLYRTVVDLCRIRIENIKLGDLPEGQYRKIEGKELHTFLSKLGIK